MLGQVGSAWRALVASCAELPRAGLEGGVPLKLKNFVGTTERLAWAKTWVCLGRKHLCARRLGRATGGADVGAGAPLPLG
jgi:hypothetical protein